MTFSSMLLALPTGYVYKLTRALYSLKRSSKDWKRTLHKFLAKDCDFSQLGTKHCVYPRLNVKDGLHCLICLFVDDMIVTYTKNSMVDAFIDKLASKWKIMHSEEPSRT